MYLYRFPIHTTAILSNTIAFPFVQRLCGATLSHRISQYNQETEGPRKFEDGPESSHDSVASKDDKSGWNSEQIHINVGHIQGKPSDAPAKKYNNGGDDIDIFSSLDDVCVPFLSWTFEYETKVIDYFRKGRSINPLRLEEQSISLSVPIVELQYGHGLLICS